MAKIKYSIENALSEDFDTYPCPQQKSHSRSHSLSSLGVGNGENENLKRSIQAVSFHGRAKPGPREWLVDNHVWKGYAATWYGEGGVAKSLLALHLGLAVASPERDYWMGFAVKRVPVIYLDFELDVDEQHRRALQICCGMGWEDAPEELYYLSGVGIPPREAFAGAAEECRRLGAGLVIVDSVGFALEGDSEISKDVLAFHRDCLNPLIEAGASPLTIDHQAKLIKGEKYSDKQAFGSVYKGNAVRSAFQIRGSWDEGKVTATFTHKKNNFGPMANDFSVEVVFSSERVEVQRLSEALPNPDREPTKRELILEAVEGLEHATAEDVATATGIGLKTVQNTFSILLKDGEIVDTKEKKNRSRIVMPHS